MRQKLILIGGGGHCASCIDVIEQEGKFDIAGVIDGEISNREILGYPIIGSDVDLPHFRQFFDFLLIAVGQINTSQVRVRLVEYVKSLGYTLPTIISPRAYVSKHATVGEGTIIMHDAVINARATVGSHCIINTKALIEHDAIVSSFSHISTAAVINGGCVIGDGAFVGSNATTKEAVKSKVNSFIKAGSIFKGQENE